MRNIYAFGEKIIYRKRDIQRLRRKYKPGQKITVTMLAEDGNESARAKRKQYTVVQTFEYHVSCIDANGFRRSFGYIELEQITVK